MNDMLYCSQQFLVSDSYRLEFLEVYYQVVSENITVDGFPGNPSVPGWSGSEYCTLKGRCLAESGYLGKFTKAARLYESSLNSRTSSLARFLHVVHELNNVLPQKIRLLKSSKMTALIE